MGKGVPTAALPARLCPPTSAVRSNSRQPASPSTISQSGLIWRRRLDLHVLRVTAIAATAQLFCMLPELVCGAGLAGIICGGRSILGDPVEGIEILPNRERCGRVDRRAVGRYAWFRLRRKQMRESGEQRADAVGSGFQVV